MTLDRRMCDAAAQWAKFIAELGDLEHSSEDQIPNQGENLSMGCSTQTSNSERSRFKLVITMIILNYKHKKRTIYQNLYHN